jgi:hypothetical protein
MQGLRHSEDLPEVEMGQEARSFLCAPPRVGNPHVLA